MAKIETPTTGEVVDAEVVVLAQAPVAVQPAPASINPMVMIDRALSTGASIETLERLMDLQERWQAGESKRAFGSALAFAKADFDAIVKNRTVDFTSQKGRTNYKHEDLSEIERAVGPALSRNGLSYRWRTTQDARMVSVTCILSHRDGYSEETTLQAPVDESGNKNPIQGIGSTITFLQRYTLKAALGLAVSHDDDGRSAGQQQPAAPSELTAKQAAHIRDLIAKSGTEEAKFLQVAGAESVEDIAASDFAKLETLLLRKIANASKASSAAK